MRPTVSVIIPLYNYEEYVPDCVYSCLQQGCESQEVIVVDDCSTDRGHATLSRLFGGSIRLLRTERNMGYSFGKNLGISASRGDYVAIIDADDMLTPGSILARTSLMDSDPAVDIVHGNAYLISEEGGYDYYIKRTGKLGITGRDDKVQSQTVMVRRSVYERFGLYDDGLRSRGDNEYWNRLRLYDENPLIVSRKIMSPPLAFYRKHSKSMVEYRKKNPFYNQEVTSKLRAAIEMRRRDGINPENTPWLEKR